MNLQYFNVSLFNLRGQAHPDVRDMLSTCEVKQSKYHIKMMINDFLTYEVKSQQSGGSPRCRLCTIDDGKYESISHIISCCPSYHDIRQKIISEMRVICENIKYINFDSIVSNNQILTQFVLDASSLNLNPSVNIDDSHLPQLFMKSRNYCYLISKQRLLLLNKLELRSNSNSV